MKIYKFSQNDWEKDEESFLNYHNTGFIEPKTYRDSEKEGGLSWLGPTTKYPKLLETKQFGDKTIEFRQSEEKLKYCWHNPEDDSIARDEHGEPIYYTDEQMQDHNLPMFETTVVAYHNDQPIGHASDEWGADGVWVEGNYQKLGIGTHLLFLFRQQFKSKRKIGQMTPTGQYMTRSYYRNYVNPQNSL